VALLVGCDGAAYLGQLQVPELLSVSRGVAMRYEGRPLLERRVNETLVGVALGFWILHKVRTTKGRLCQQYKKAARKMEIQIKRMTPSRNRKE
jgi:hypothetical protein